MNKYYLALRQPVRRPGAEPYLLVTLLSFALSVSLLRLILELTGYPQLGSGGLHISHVLWGGLLLFIAAMLPLLLANRWVYWLVSILAGVGIGLFIDEVGKFITESYDYFYPPAAPIVYAFFLVCVLVYLQATRPRPRSGRGELYATLELMEEVLDHDLEDRERTEINDRLQYVIDQEGNPDLVRLAVVLKEYFSSDQYYLAPTRQTRLNRIAVYFRSSVRKYVSQERLRWILIIAIGLLGLVTVAAPGQTLVSMAINPSQLEGREQLWFAFVLVIQVILGLALIYSAILFILNRTQQGLRISYICLIVYLTIINIFLFYYNQFSTIISAIIQFGLLIAVIYAQQNYYSENKGAEREPAA